MTSTDASYDKQAKNAKSETKWIAIGIVFAWLIVGVLGSQWLADIIGGSDVIAADSAEPDAALQVSAKIIDGPYGDTFGVLTAVFTGLALAGLWYTIRLQGIELQATRDVLKQQSDQLKEQASHLAKQSGHLEEQSRIARTQVVEATFFQLLQRFSEVAQDVCLHTDEKPGRAAMKAHYKSFLRRADVVFQNERAAKSGDAAKGIITRAFADHLREHGSELNHYFRTLYHTLKFIHENAALLDGDKIRYANLARAQLSTYELALIFYNGVTGEGIPKFHELVTQYGMLKHIDPTILIDPTHSEGDAYYHPKAFLGSERRRAFR